MVRGWLPSLWIIELIRSFILLPAGLWQQKAGQSLYTLEGVRVGSDIAHSVRYFTIPFWNASVAALPSILQGKLCCWFKLAAAAIIILIYLSPFNARQVYRAVKYYYIVESRTVWPNLWRVVNLIHILLILAHWFGCFYFLLSEAEGFQVKCEDNSIFRLIIIASDLSQPWI